MLAPPPFLLGICLPSPWSPSFPLHALALILLSFVKVRLSPTLTLSPLMIWYPGQTALFLFLLARTALEFLPTALSVALRPLFPFQQPQFVPVFPLKPAPFCTLFAGIGNTNKSAISLLLISDSRSVLSSIFSLLSNSVADLVGTVFSLLFYGLRWSPDTRFSRGTTRLMSWQDGERYLRPPLSLVVSLPLFTLLFSWSGGVLSHLNSLTNRFPHFHRGTCAPSSCSLCPLSSSLQWTQPSFRFLSLYNWQNRESFLQRLRTLVSGHFSSRSALSSYGLFAPLCLSKTSDPDPWELSGFGGSMAFRHAPIPRKESGNQQQSPRQVCETNFMKQRYSEMAASQSPNLSVSLVLDKL